MLLLRECPCGECAMTRADVILASHGIGPGYVGTPVGVDGPSMSAGMDAVFERPSRWYEPLGLTGRSTYSHEKRLQMERDADYYADLAREG